MTLGEEWLKMKRDLKRKMTLGEEWLDVGKESGWFLVLVSLQVEVGADLGKKYCYQLAGREQQNMPWT